MKTQTFFFLTEDAVYRAEVPMNLNGSGLNAYYKIIGRSNQVIKVTDTGRGITVKNRLSEKVQYFTKKQMVMLSLQAENYSG